MPGFYLSTGVGEDLQRISSKFIVPVLIEDIIKCAGTLQVSNEQDADIKTAIHSINMMCEVWCMMYAILLVDETNAFSLLNIQPFLHNISYLCLSITIFVKIFYSTPSRFFIVEGTELHQSKEQLKVIQSQWRSII